MSEILPIVDIVIVNFNCSAYVIDCIKSLHDYTRTPYRLIVIDSASIADERTKLKAYIDTVETSHTFIQLEVNKGFGYANNASLEYLTAPYVLLLNPDTIITNSAIDDCVEALESNKDYACVAPLLVNSDGSPQSSVYRFPTITSTFKEFFLRQWKMPTVRQLGLLQDVEGVTGAFMLVDRKVIDHIGLFDSAFFMYMEEVDLCKRIALTGRKIGLLTKSPVIHFGGGSSSTMIKPSLYREMYRSRLKYFRKYYSGIYLQVLTLTVKIGLFINVFVGIGNVLTKRKQDIRVIQLARIASQLMFESC